jgi:hypothetical protein
MLDGLMHLPYHDLSSGIFMDGLYILIVQDEVSNITEAYLRNRARSLRNADKQNEGFETGFEI